MKIDFRLYMFGLSKKALNELYMKELTKKEWEYKGWGEEYEEDDMFDPTIFDKTNLDILFNGLRSNENYPLFPFLKALKNVISDLHNTNSTEYSKYLFNYVEQYFELSPEYRQVADSIKEFHKSEEGRIKRDEAIAFMKKIHSPFDYCEEDAFLHKLTQKFVYYPYFNNPSKPQFHTIENLKCVNELEEDYIKEKGNLNLMDLRDYLFSVGFYPDKSYLNGTLFTEIEMAARKFLEEIVIKVYWNQIFRANLQFKELIQTINEVIDAKWNILLSKFKRGVYTDEWGVIHQDVWEKDLRYFALNVAADSDTVPDFLLYFKIDIEYIMSELESLAYDNDHIVVSIFLHSDSSALWEVKRANGALLKSKKDEFVVNLCSLLFYIKMKFGNNAQDEIQINELMTENSSILNPNILNSYNNGRDFEFLIKEQLENYGYTISLTPITGDQGVDIIATRNGQKYAIQCKSYSGQVGNAAVQEVIAGKIFYDCDYACVITNSNFTPSAYQLAAKAGVIMCANENLESLK